MRDLGAGRIPLQRLRVVGSPPSFGRQVIRFAAIGVASTLAYAALYVLLRLAMPAQVANALALLVTAVGNTAANRRLTFAIRGSAGVVRHQLQGLLVFGLALALTGGALGALHALSPQPSRALELAVLTSANLVATVLRFVLLRVWVFRTRRSAPR
jgi:putative flippase GtrA